MVEACSDGQHYLDITAKSCFEAMANAKSRKNDGIMISQVSFSMFASAAWLAFENRLPRDNLTLAFMEWRQSRTARSDDDDDVGRGGAIRKDGEIVQVPAAWRTREIDFGEFTKMGVTIPWGDVSTAFYSTGIPNIEVYAVLPEENLRLLRLSRYIGWLLATKPVQNYLQKQIPEGGPNEASELKQNYLGRSIGQ